MKENTLHLPLHRLFVQLQTNGLYIGAAERLRIQQLLVDGGAWMNEEGRAALKYEIAPLICRNNQEQEVFYKLYEDFLQGLSEALLPIATPPKSANWFQKHKRALYWAGLLLVILSGVWLLFYIIPKKEAPKTQISDSFKETCPNKPEVQDSIRVLGNGIVGAHLKFQAPEGLKSQWKKEWSISDGTGFEKIAKPEYTFQKTGNYTLLLAISDTTQEGYCTTTLSKAITIAEEIPVKKSFSNWVKILGILLLLVCLWFLWRWWRRQGIKVPAREPQISPALSNALEPKERPPFTIPYRSNNHYIQQATEQITLANTLRRRQSGEQTSLDIPKSIHATIAKMGYAELHFNSNTRPAHYLFLLDLQSEVSHQAQLFSYLVSILLEQEVLADVFFYKKDFSHFWNKLHPEGLSLELLAMQYGDRRLVIFGDGDRLISENIGGGWHHPEWVDSLKRWPQRMLITPVPIASWGLRETRLYKVLAVFQADLGGLMQAAGFVEGGMQEENLPLTFAEWQNQCLNSLIDTDTERLWRSPADHRAYLAEANGEEVLYRWLRALVVYPELNWNITVAIGKALGVDVSFEHLLTLARIPWLNEGNMKLSLWRAWWKELPKEDERIAREAVKLELEAVAEQSAQGFADQKLQIRLAVQQFALAPDDDSAQDAIRFILDNVEPSAQLNEELKMVVTRHDSSVTADQLEPIGNGNNINGNKNVIEKVTDSTIIISKNGVIYNIRNNLVALMSFLEMQRTQQIQIGGKVYNISEIGQAEFNNIINSYLEESKSSLYPRWLMVGIVLVLAIGLAYFWYYNQVLSKPFNLSVRVDNRTPNAELPQAEAKITLTYGDKVETLTTVKEGTFKNIPPSLRNKVIRVKCEVSGFFTVDTSFVLENELLIIPIYHDKSFAEIKGNVTLDTTGDEIIPLEGVDVEVQGLHSFTDANGNFALQIPFAKQRTEQRVILRKKGYGTWDQTVPIIANEQMRVTLRKLR